MASKTKQKKRRDPGKETPSPRCGGEQRPTTDGGCCKVEMCGEHGGKRPSMAFCHATGHEDVRCSLLL